MTSQRLARASRPWGSPPLAAALFALASTALQPACAPDARVCVPGATRACACPTGSTGVQTCADTADRWERCDCGDSPPGADGATSNDATAPPGSDGGGPSTSLTACTRNDQCAAGAEVCAFFMPDGTGRCLRGPAARSCATPSDYCINGMTFDRFAEGEQPYLCDGMSACPVVDGTRIGVCTDRGTDPSGQRRRCLLLCQYAEDNGAGYVTDPRGGISVCSRRDAEIVAAVSALQWCHNGLVVASARCLPGVPYSSELASTLDCLRSRLAGTSCIAFASCFREVSSAAPLGVTQFFDQIAQHVQLAYRPAPPGGTSGSLAGRCGTDCDCGRCSYCESGTCRYAGEGPYGCYRGCS